MPGFDAVGILQNSQEYRQATKGSQQTGVAPTLPQKHGAGWFSEGPVRLPFSLYIGFQQTRDHGRIKGAEFGTGKILRATP